MNDSEMVWGRNHAVNASTVFSPADLLFSCRGGLVPGLPSDSRDTAQAGEAKLLAARRKATENLAGSSRRMKARYDKRRKVATEYEVGDLVLWGQVTTCLGERGVNRKIANKQGVRGYRRFKAVVAADALRRYQSGACVNGAESGGDSRDSEIERSGRQDLIDLLES